MKAINRSSTIGKRVIVVVALCFFLGAGMFLLFGAKRVRPVWQSDLLSAERIEVYKVIKDWGDPEINDIFKRVSSPIVITSAVERRIKGLIEDSLRRPDNVMVVDDGKGNQKFCLGIVDPKFVLCFYKEHMRYDLYVDPSFPMFLLYKGDAKYRDDVHSQVILEGKEFSIDGRLSALLRTNDFNQRVGK